LAQEEKTVFGIDKNISNTLTLDQRQKIFPEILEHLPTVDAVYFAGGEPLLSTEHYKILDQLLKIQRNDVELTYNTNFTNFSFKQKSVFDYWKKFTKVKIGASLDGHGKVVEYIRHGTEWAKIENNLLQLKTQIPHVKFQITSTVSLLSVISIIELQQMWHTQNKVTIDNFSIGFVFDKFLNLQVLPGESKILVSKKILEHIQWLIENSAPDRLIQSWQEVNSFMLADDQSHMLKKMWYFTKKRDQARNECFEEIFPDFYNNIKSYV
jgi:hypothetical protein